MDHFLDLIKLFNFNKKYSFVYIIISRSYDHVYIYKYITF